MGSHCRVSEVMTGKRELSMTMVRKLRERFHISADLLISPTSGRGLKRQEQRRHFLGSYRSSERIAPFSPTPARQLTPFEFLDTTRDGGAAMELSFNAREQVP